MQKYFISENDFESRTITGDDAFHIRKVLRMKSGDKVIVSNNSKAYLVSLTAIGDEVSFEIIEELIGNVELPVFVSIFQGYPKGDKLDDIIKHGTEYGAYDFTLTMMKRCVVKIEESKKQNKLLRYNKIAKEAAEQSNRNIVPRVVDILDLKKIDFSSYDHKILCYEEDAKAGEASNLKSIIRSLKKDDKIAVVIGPEGGIDDKELEYLKSIGFTSCALGPRILRTESALYYVLSSISYEMELK